MAVVGSLHGRSTASPFETKSLSKKMRKSRKLKKKTPQHHEIDSWLKKSDELKKDLVSLFDKISKKSNKRLPIASDSDNIDNKDAKETDKNSADNRNSGTSDSDKRGSGRKRDQKSVKDNRPEREDVRSGRSDSQRSGAQRD
jgi:hypothetical protein